MSCGAQGTVAVTSNGGISWKRVQAAGDNDYLNQIQMVNNNIGYVCGEDGKILKTSNGGLNWITQNSNVTSGLYSLYFFNENSGWVCGDSGKLLKTTDGGNNYLPVNSGSQRYISDICFTDPLTGWYASGSRKIYKTTNGGDNWYVPHSDSLSGGAGAVQFVTNETGLGFTYSNKIIISSDGGNSWNEIDIPPNNYLNNIFASDEKNFWAVGDFGFIYRSTDKGISWFQETNNNFDGRLFGIYFSDNDNGWVAGGNGLIAKYTNPMSNISSNISSNEITGYKLNQNYPNPFNPSTKLEFGISKLGFVSLKVYDILGKEIATLVNERLSPGTYRYDFDGSGLTSGNYFYILNADGYSETKKMLLLK
ncbi:MAG: T9SS type A sorting domain-containing protein [Ignavibacteria bacterium]|nr:T9SS type A sorting domain-containing protein [Ignavibacteria bacterium]